MYKELESGASGAPLKEREVSVKAFGAYRLYLLDMDGTFYLGNRLLPGALDFIRMVQKTRGEYLFLTNNSSRTSEEYAAKLRRLGLDTQASHVMTSGEATIELLKRDGKWRRLCLCAPPAVEEQFRKAGFILDSEVPEAVVLTYDTTLDYQRIREVALGLRRGLPFIATHPDINCPSPEGPLPDLGAFLAMFEASTGRKPDLVVGKPRAEFIEAAMVLKGFGPSETLMIGDRLYTDIACGNNAGVDTALVLSGESTRDMVADSPHKPDFIFEGLHEIAAILG